MIPFTFVLSNPFENWTRSSPELLGTIFLYLGYNCPLEELRVQLHDVLEQSELWDKRVEGVVVTECKPGIWKCLEEL